MANEIQKSDPTPYLDKLRGHMFANKGRYASALDGLIDFDRFAVTAIASARRTPGLADCSIESVHESIARCAELGLEPGGPLGHAYLIPFKVKGKAECTLVIGYKGWLHMMFRGGGVRDAEAHVVFEEDLRNGFKMVRTSGGTVIHHPMLWTPEAQRGKPIGAYSVIRFTNGGCHVEAMSADEVEKVKAASPSVSTDFSPWNGPFKFEMWKKTPLKRGAKWAPTGRDYTLMARAWDYDAEHDIVEGQAKEVRHLQTVAPPKELAGETAVRAVENAPERQPEKVSEREAPNTARSTPPTPPSPVDEKPQEAPKPLDEKAQFQAMCAELYACESNEQVDAFIEKHTGWAGAQRAELAARIKERRAEIRGKGKTRKEQAP